MKIQGTPFVPGCNYGKVSYWWESNNDLSQTVIVLREPTIDIINSLKNNKPCAILVSGKQRFSHSLIYLFSLNTPTLLIEPDEKIPEGCWIFIDGETGLMEVSESGIPPELWKKKLKDNCKKGECSIHNGISLTKDNHQICLEASVNNNEGAVYALKKGVKNIGLIRTELFFSQNQMAPSVKEHQLLIEQLLNNKFTDKVSIRLLDFGGGKTFNWIPDDSSLNDSLGIRGCRAFSHPHLNKILYNQLEAISQYSNNSKLSVIVPFVSNIDEFINIKRKIRKILGDKISINAMVETPSAIFTLPEISEISDEIIIGTNDLIQCFFGASREIPNVSEQLRYHSPEFLRLLDFIAKQQSLTKKQIKLCGHLPLLPSITEFLVALGFTKFSIEPLFLDIISNRINDVSYNAIKKKRNKILKSRNEKETLDSLMNL
jgi:phosphoenolpyruvate-protein kinase (PTS system EI component)